MKRIFLQWLLTLLTILYRLLSLNSATAFCDFSFVDGNKLYNYTLTSPTRKFPHGVLSEDGFYKVAMNETILWFQLCDGMVFNHDPPRCVDCWDCGGPMRCGMGCNAHVAENIGGYPVCTTIGRGSKVDVNILDKKNPHIGVIVKMSSSGAKGPLSMERLGTCDYATEIKHPSGCAVILNVHGKGWGWFGTLITTVFCLFGAYLLVGIVYRFFTLGIRGIDVIPNLDFWASLPRRTHCWFASLMRKFNGPSQGYRNSYSPVNF